MNYFEIEDHPVYQELKEEKYPSFIKEISVNELIYTNFGNKSPLASMVCSIPYMNKERKPYENGPQWYPVVNFYSDGTAIGYYRTYKYEYTDNLLLTKKFKKLKNKNPIVIRYFAIGCLHKYRSMTSLEVKDKNISLFHCDNAYICDLCKHFYVVNSSDWKDVIQNYWNVFPVNFVIYLFFNTFEG